MGIWVIVCVQKPSDHILQTFRPLRMFKIVFRDSSLYPKPLSLYCLPRAYARRLGLGLIPHFSLICCKNFITCEKEIDSFRMLFAKFVDLMQKLYLYMLWHSDERVLLPCLNAQPDIFAVMNCCIVALNAFSSDILAWSADILVYIQCQGHSRGTEVDKTPLELDILQKLYNLHKGD